MKIAKNITELIGNTPLVRLNKASERCGANIIAKCEFMNPTSSVKDRIGFNMIRRAIEAGYLFAFIPVLLDSLILLAIALVINNLSNNPKRHYPRYWY